MDFNIPALKDNLYINIQRNHAAGTVTITLTGDIYTNSYMQVRNYGGGDTIFDANGQNMTVLYAGLGFRTGQQSAGGTLAVYMGSGTHTFSKLGPGFWDTRGARTFYF